MAAAVRLALRTRPVSRPNPGVAALLVKDGRVLARGWTQAGGRPHAEAMALAGFANGEASGATLYVTLEPCAHKSGRGPACSDLIINAGPEKVVIGLLDPDPRTAGTGAKRIGAAGIGVEILDHPGAIASLSGFLKGMTLGRPHVTLKLAMSLDGCIAMADGASHWITGEAARAHVHSRRAQHDAILVGGGTWRTDNPRLDVRLSGLEARSPDRFVLTSGVAPDGVQAINAPHRISDLDGVQYLYVEGGASTAAAFLEADLVDELHLYRAPVLIGDGLRGIGDIGLSHLSEAHGRWHQTDIRALGSDTFSAYLRTR